MTTELPNHCSNCKHWLIMVNDEPSAQEKFDADPRPTIKSFIDNLKFLWDPQQFKLKPDEFEDDYYRKQWDVCTRFPKSVETPANHYCAEWVAKD